MRVLISAGGKFWALYLAQQLLKRNFLERLIISMPQFEVAKYGIPREKTKTIAIKEILERGWRKTPKFLKNACNPQFFIHEIFDRIASRKIIPSDIFVGWSSFSLYSLRKAKQLGAKIIIERGNSHILYQQEILKEEYEKFKIKGELAHPKIIEKELKEYEEADYIIVPSSFVKRTFLEKEFANKKIIIVPFGVDLKSFQQISKTDSAFRIIFSGTICLRKGVQYLLRAFSELNLPNSELALIGAMSNEIKPFLKKYENKYKYLGHFPQNELYKYYSQGSVFVMPSIEEGLARVIPQAMSCGLPIIATTNTGGEDIIRDNIDGFIIPIRDIEKLKEKILYFHNNPEICKKMGESAKKRIQKGFSWNDYGDKVIESYGRILDTNNF